MWALDMKGSLIMNGCSGFSDTTAPWIYPFPTLFDDVLVYSVAEYGYRVGMYLLHDTRALALFLGQTPHTNAVLKSEASTGSHFFDLVYTQVAKMYGITHGKDTHVAPNDKFVELYTAIVFSQVTPVDVETAQYAENRHWNNKGNSMEALMFYLHNVGNDALVWVTAYMCFHLSHNKSHYWFARDLH